MKIIGWTIGVILISWVYFYIGYLIMGKLDDDDEYELKDVPDYLLLSLWPLFLVAWIFMGIVQGIGFIFTLPIQLIKRKKKNKEKSVRKGKGETEMRKIAQALEKYDRS